MKIVQRLRSSNRLVFGIILVVSMLLIAACQPIVDPATMEARQSGETASTEALFEVEPARATINADSLRVRQGPSDEYDLVAGVKVGETYDVLAMSSDGAWIQLAVDRAEDGQGWVSTEFVTLEGDITNIETVPAEGAAAEEVASAEEAAPAEEESSQETASSEEAATDEAAMADDEMAEDEMAAGDGEDASDMEAMGEALIQTPLPLRVRSEPTDEVDNKIGSVYNLETYPVLDISDDGLWILIDVPKLSDSGGWVWWENVVLSGDIADEVATVADGSPEDEADMAEAAAGETEEASAEADDMEAAEGDMAEGDMAEGEMAETADAETATEGTDMQEADAAQESEADMASEDEAPAEIVDAQEVLIQTPLPLRVRSAPTSEEDNKIGNVFDGESYPVLEISEDGLWVKIFVPELSDEGGWVSAEYVVMGE